jgi:DNA-binding MarR family transcriptional regulator
MPKTLQPLSQPSTSRSGRGFGYQVVRLAELVMAHGEKALAPLGLAPRAFEAMNCIMNGHGMSQQDLSQSLGLYAPQMVSLIDGLEQRGLVKRLISPTDRRRHVLSLTPSGGELLKSASKIAENLELELFSSITEDDRARFEELIGRLEALEKQDEVGE